MESYDYIVVGAGSSGCVAAARLTEKPSNEVLVIEAGDFDRDPWIHIPATFFKVIEKGKDIIVYESETQPSLNGRRAMTPQGYVLGGGSSVNAMIYIRGAAQDYDAWAQAGNIGWSYQDVLPVFCDLEHNMNLHDRYHGDQGALYVSNPDYKHPLSAAFIDAAKQSGLQANADFNGADQAGVGFYQCTIKNGRRWSAAKAFLHPALQRPNLNLLTGRRCARLLFEGKRAVGVELEDGSVFRADKEIILCAGAIETPRLLQLSGIGSAEALGKLGISSVVDLPGVGANYQDHYETPVQAETRGVTSFLNQDRGFAALSHMLRYLLTRKGLLSSNVVASGGFATVLEDRPDTQFHVLPVVVGFIDRVSEQVHGITVNPCWLRPRSRGSVKLRSNNPKDKALIDPNMLSDAHDLEGQVRGVELALRILRAPALASLISRPILPTDKMTSRDALVEHIRNTSKTVFHPSGTCKMGPQSDKMAVVAPNLKVYGLENLRVADVSIMPTLVSGNTNAPAMMIAEQCTRFMRRDA